MTWAVSAARFTRSQYAGLYLDKLDVRWVSRGTLVSKMSTVEMLGTTCGLDGAVRTEAACTDTIVLSDSCSEKPPALVGGVVTDLLLLVFAHRAL